MSNVNNPTVFNAGIVFDQTIHGSSPNYGSPKMTRNPYNSPSALESYNPGTIVSVANGDVLTFKANPAQGFKLDYWSQSVSSSNIYTENSVITVNGSDVILTPVYKPLQRTFNRQITVTASGISETDNVTVSSMNGYYSYTQSSSVSGTSVLYNDQQSISSGRLPDGEKITVGARIISGYNIRFYSNGTEINPVQGTGTGRYRYAEIVNQVTTVPLNISVVYEADVTYYTVSVNADPSGGGNVYVNEGSEWNHVEQTRITVPDGTQVTIYAQHASGKEFSRWESNEELVTQVTENPHTYTVHRSENWTAKFTSAVTTITAQSDPSIGGIVSIDDGHGVTQTGAVAHVDNSQTVQSTLTLEATPNNDYIFQYWYNEITPEDHDPDYRKAVEFGDTDATYIAQFLYSPITVMTLYPRVGLLDNGDIGLFDTTVQARYIIEYLDRNSITRDVTVDQNYSSNIQVLVQTDQTGRFVQVKFDGLQSFTTEENGHRYRYTLSGYKYAEGYVSYEQSPEWTDATLENGVWTITLGHGTTRIPDYTVVGCYEKVEIFNVYIDIHTPSGTYTGITVTGSGDYVSGATVELTETVVDTDRYVFDGWYDIDSSDYISHSGTYQFTIDSDIRLEARYDENCYLDYGAVPDDLGDVTCVETGTQNTVDGGYWYPYGKELTFTCVPDSGVELQGWYNGSLPMDESGMTFDYVLTSSTTITAQLMETSKEIQILPSEGGTVTLEMRASSEDDYNIASGTDNTYTVPLGYQVRLTAHPQVRYNFAGFTIQDDNSNTVTTMQNPLELTEIDSDLKIAAAFAFIPWINTLGTIIKVY